MKHGLLPLLTSATLCVLAPSSAHAGGHFGIMLDGGVPDGANASLVFRPASGVRLHTGGSYNTVSAGMRAGVTLAFDWIVTPCLAIEGGWFFPGDANSLVQKLSGDDQWSSEALEHFKYNYANAHLGVEFNLWRFSLYVHGGASVIETSFNRLSFDLGDEPELVGGDPTPKLEFRKDPRVRALLPSARVGLVYYF